MSAISDAERNILALPCQLGGMGLTNPTKSCAFHYKSSEKITTPLINLNINGEECPHDVWDDPGEVRSEKRKKS